MKRVLAEVSGRVQGVWFRASTQEKALELGVRGYVRNLPNGNVEFAAVGEDEKVDALLEWANRGPQMARVDKVRVGALLSNEEFDTFSITY
jgi:acylphosphatase